MAVSFAMEVQLCLVLAILLLPRISFSLWSGRSWTYLDLILLGCFTSVLGIALGNLLAYIIFIFIKPNRNSTGNQKNRDIPIFGGMGALKGNCISAIDNIQLEWHTVNSVKSSLPQYNAQRIAAKLGGYFGKSWLDSVLRHSENSLFADNVRQGFLSWFPVEKNTSSDNIISKLNQKIAAAESLRQELAAANRQLADWKRAMQHLDPLNEPSPERAESQLVKLYAKADFTGFLDSLSIDAFTRGRVETGLDVWNLVHTRISAPLLDIMKEIPEPYRQKTPIDEEDLTQAIGQLCNAVRGLAKAVTDSPAPGSVVTLKHLFSLFPPESALPDEGLTLENLDDTFRSAFDQQLALGRAHHEKEACTQQQQLARALGFLPDLPWGDSLNYVRILRSHVCTELFDVEDVPKYDNCDDYWSWRCRFALFTQCHDVVPGQIGLALVRVFRCFEGEPLKTFMGVQEFSTFVQPTWAETCEKLLEVTDRYCLTPNTWYDRYEKWRAMRPSQENWGQNFVWGFTGEYRTLNGMAKVTKNASIGEAEAVRQLLWVVPDKARAEFEINNPRYRTEMSIGEVNKQLIRYWSVYRDRGLLDRSVMAPYDDHDDHDTDFTIDFDYDHYFMDEKIQDALHRKFNRAVAGMDDKSIRRGIGSIFPALFSPCASTHDMPLGCFRPYSGRWIRHTRSNERQVLLFADGACLGNGQPNSRGGWAVLIGPADEDDDSQPCAVSGALERRDPFGVPAKPASNRAELRAAIAALRLQDWDSEGFDTIVVATGSQLIVSGATVWVKGWIRKGWRTRVGKPVKNKDLWEALLGEVERWNQRGVAIRFWKIPKHHLSRSVHEEARKAARREAPEHFADMRLI